MILLRSLEQALTNLRANKLRSALTMLGVIIGVSAVIILVSIVEGARARVFNEFERLGSKMIFIVYDPNDREVKKTGRRFDGMTMDDVRAIQTRCNLIENLSAEASLGDAPTTRGDKEMTAKPTGVQPDYLFIRDLNVVRGRSITQTDMDNWAKVCVIGDKVRRELFGKDDPLGETITIRGVTATVVGVLEAKGKTFGQDDADASILVPITTVQKRYRGTENVDVIFAQPKDGVPVTAAMDQIWETLMRRHDNVPGFRVDSQENILNSLGRIAAIFGLVVGAVAGLSLLVGGIGVMNIMLVSVTERTREIGIRKAIGAKQRDILLQFLIESATLSGVGGLIGIGFGAGVAFGISALSKMTKASFAGGEGIPAYLPLWIVIGAFAFSAGVGVFFGIYPAFRASQLDPIDALRHE